jgi:hypothetical protein
MPLKEDEVSLSEVLRRERRRMLDLQQQQQQHHLSKRCLTILMGLYHGRLYMRTPARGMAS